jgi:dTDP-4-dehydrorhamnose reductase
LTSASSKQIAWITGAGGLIGNYLVQTTPINAPHFQVAGLTRAELDLTDYGAVKERFSREKPSIMIHCAALSSSVECEKNPSLAKKLNVEVTENLAELSANIPFVFLSTDLVFDGGAGNYDESSATNPLSVYGETKVAAENIVLANPKHTVVRTSLNGGASPTGNRGFNEQLRVAWQKGEMTKLFFDEFRSPIAAEVTARAVWELISKNATGLYHVAGAERLSRLRIGELIAARWPELNPKIEPASLKDYRGGARPADCSLNCAKVQKTLSFQLPGLTEWLAENPSERF